MTSDRKPKPKPLKRGSNGKGQAEALGMLDAYKRENIVDASTRCSQCHCYVMDKWDQGCECRCHDVARIVARFTL